MVNVCVTGALQKNQNPIWHSWVFTKWKAWQKGSFYLAKRIKAGILTDLKLEFAQL